MRKLTRRLFLGSAGASIASAFSYSRPAVAVDHSLDDEVVFAFISDVHACRMASGLSPNCLQEGKTDSALLRHIKALNRLPETPWPMQIDGKPSGLTESAQNIGALRGVVVGGDMTDDGGGQTVQPGEGTQLIQFSQRYVEGHGPDRVHFPVYTGLGNHDLDQDGPAPHVGWYRRVMRGYVEMNHEPSADFKPPVPVASFDDDSDAYSWDWGDVHFIQLHRFGGDLHKGAVSALPWLKADLLQRAGNGRPVVLFQHYGWDHFSLERWDGQGMVFDDAGQGAAHWWTPDERRALLDTLAGYNVLALFHGHEHPTPMIYEAEGLSLVKPKAAFMGGFAVARINRDRFEVALGEAADDNGAVRFTTAFSKALR